MSGNNAGRSLSMYDRKYDAIVVAALRTRLQPLARAPKFRSLRCCWGGCLRGSGMAAITRTEAPHFPLALGGSGTLHRHAASQQGSSCEHFLLSAAIA